MWRSPLSVSPLSFCADTDHGVPEDEHVRGMGSASAFLGHEQVEASFPGSSAPPSSP